MHTRQIWKAGFRIREQFARDPDPQGDLDPDTTLKEKTLRLIQLSGSDFRLQIRGTKEKIFLAECCL